MNFKGEKGVAESLVSLHGLDGRCVAKLFFADEAGTCARDAIVIRRWSDHTVRCAFKPSRWRMLGVECWSKRWA
jgi:hypothetical protein